ncbi:hypothetical protein LINPERPRIM_LOCUS13925 [Linum perenne]
MSFLKNHGSFRRSGTKNRDPLFSPCGVISLPWSSAIDPIINCELGFYIFWVN